MTAALEERVFSLNAEKGKLRYPPDIRQKRELNKYTPDCALFRSSRAITPNRRGGFVACTEENNSKRGGGNRRKRIFRESTGTGEQEEEGVATLREEEKFRTARRILYSKVDFSSRASFAIVSSYISLHSRMFFSCSGRWMGREQDHTHTDRVAAR